MPCRFVCVFFRLRQGANSRSCRQVSRKKGSRRGPSNKSAELAESKRARARQPVSIAAAPAKAAAAAATSHRCMTTPTLAAPTEHAPSGGASCVGRQEFSCNFLGARARLSLELRLTCKRNRSACVSLRSLKKLRGWLTNKRSSLSGSGSRKT